MDRGFATLRRQWQSGDRIDLHLPMETRLEAINPRHPETVALVRGPLVLFPLGGTGTPEVRQSVTRQQLLAARRVDEDRWQAGTAEGAIDLVPFTSVGERRYSTYLTAT
jgi:DUF1680 family protein